MIFDFVIRAGKANFGDVFYDINLEVDKILPRTIKDVSEIKKSTSKSSIRNNSENVKNNLSKRGYNIKRIKMSTLQTSQFSELTRKSRKIGSSAVDSISVSQLYSLVKKYDKDFHAGKKVSPYLLNENGTPRKFYHGTAEKSLAYWYGRNIKGLLEYAVNNDAPYVLKDGEVIDYQTNWKNRGYDTAVIVAPITIATVFGRDGLYDYIQSEIIKGNLVRIKNRSNQVGELTAEIADSYGKIASTNSIRNNSENVKTKVFK